MSARPGPRRVLLVGKGPPDRGGISAYLHSLLGAADQLSHELRLLNLTRDEEPAAGRLTVANLIRTLVDARRVFTAARDADIVHIHTALVPSVTMVRAAALAAAARTRRTRVVVHVHSGRVQLWLSTPARRLLVRLLLFPAHSVVAVSQGAELALAAALPRAKVLLIDNCVDPRAFDLELVPHDPPRILYAGLLTPRKGLLDLIAASEILKARAVDHEVLLAGGTPDEGPDAEREVRDAAAARAQVLGPIPHEDMPEVYRQADIFCLPSWWEAMPLSLLEALAAGLPAVATRVGDIPRLLHDGATGRLVEPRDAPGLAVVLEELLTDPEARRSLGEAGRAAVRRDFNLAGMLAALESLYDRL